MTRLNRLELIFLATANFFLAQTLALPPFSSQDYRTVLKLSLLFYEAQRSGPLPENNRISWRGDSALTDRGHNGEDLTGGYYDGSDFVKFGCTMAFTTTILSWGMLSFKDAYVAAGLYEDGLAAVKWATDYFLKCHVSPNEFYGQVGDFQLDYNFWGRPEDMNMTRPAYKIDINQPASDLAGEAAAAFASAGLLFRDVNATYAAELLRHAAQLFEFADRHTGLYHVAVPNGKHFYESTGYGDELTWAAAWLFKATKNVTYREQAESFYSRYRINDRPNEFSYDKKVAGIQLLLAEQTLLSEYVTAVENFCDYSIDHQTRTPKGLVFIEKFGTLSHAANVAFICLQAANLNISRDKYTAFAKEQIDYILGSTGKSYVVGFGSDYPIRPHHSASSCPDRPAPCGWAQFHAKSPNPQILYGALVSGPDQNDHYKDDREEYLYNEVTLYYNAGFQSAVAGLMHYQMLDKDSWKIRSR